LLSIYKFFNAQCSAVLPTSGVGFLLSIYKFFNAQCSGVLPTSCNVNLIHLGLFFLPNLPVKSK
jgi:hypothetical protein